MRVPSPWTYHLPKIPPLNTITLGIGCEHMNLREGVDKYSDHSRVQQKGLEISKDSELEKDPIGFEGRKEETEKSDTSIS